MMVLPVGSGGRLQGDGVAEGLQLADVVALVAVGVDVAVVEVGTEIVETSVGSASRCQQMIRMERPTATTARLAPRRRAMRR
jgi:hypothetical protein